MNPTYIHTTLASIAVATILISSSNAEARNAPSPAPTSSGEYSYYAYQDEKTGLYGVKYQDETVIIPQYTELKGVNRVALFAYRDAETNKWGLVSTYDIITPPIYDSIKVVDAIRSNKTFANVTLNGKQGLLSPLGNEVLPLEYDSIGQPYWDPDVLEYKWGKNKVYPHVFPVKKNGQWQIVTYYNAVVVDNFPAELLENGRIKSSVEDKVLKNLIGKPYKELVKRAKKDESVAAMIEKDDKGDLKYADFAEPRWPNPEIASAPIEIYGQKGKVNELGVVWVDESIFRDIGQDIPQYNSYNVYTMLKKLQEDAPKLVSRAWYQNYDAQSQYEIDASEKRRNDHFINGLIDIVQVCKVSGLEGSDFYNYIVDRLKQRGELAAKLENDLADDAAKLEWENRVNAISNSIVGALNNAMSALESADGNASDSSDSASSSASASSRTPSSKGNKYNMSEQHSYNSDKRVYASYDSMLAAYFAGNRHASISEKEEWQSKMKSLRTKWESKGKSFPHSANEDR